jgi:hypothetical protein
MSTGGWCWLAPALAAALVIAYRALALFRKVLEEFLAEAR